MGVVESVVESRPRRSHTAACLNCLSIDVEEYFHCEVFSRGLERARWGECERRAARYVECIADLLERNGSRGTFFVLGWMVEHCRGLLRRLSAAGHEIACHGDGHEHLARMNSASLQDDLRRARERLADAVGSAPAGYRAPTFSVTRATAWALDVIIAAGFEYDASIFPIHHDRYGVPGAPSDPFWAVAPSGRRIREFPPLTLGWPGARFPVGGGGYLRLLPITIVERALARRTETGRPAMLYVHPWELDPEQPRIAVGPVAQWRHRVNLGATYGKLARLAERFRFTTAACVLDQLDGGELPSYSL